MHKCVNCSEADKAAFNKNSSKKSGLQDSCRSCSKDYMKTYRENNKKKMQECKSNWYQNNKEHASNYRQTWRKNNRLAHKSHNAVTYALQTGVIEPPENCQKCNKKEALDAHHEDYKKPLEVIWVCKRCHARIHA